MKKTNTFSAAIITIALFSGAASAYTDQQSEDILYGKGTLAASPKSAYIRADTGPKDVRDYLLWNLHEIENVSNYTPYVHIENDRDNRDDLLFSI